jgi:RecA/RadA recombinase
MPKIKEKKSKSKPVAKDNKVDKKTKLAAPNLSKLYSDLAQAIDDKFELSTGDFSPQKLSLGLLAVDYICAGGIVRGMTTLSGFEGSAKSSLMFHTLGSCLNANVSLIRMDDAEGTLDGLYTSNIIGQQIADLMPQRKKGKLINDPRVWYSSNNIIENYYDSLVQTFDSMPDKLYNSEAKAWFYVVNKKNKHQTAFVSALKGAKSDPALNRGRFLYYPTENTAPQGVFFLDSYAVMIPLGTSEKQKTNNMPTGPAIKFSVNIPRVTGYFKRKNIILFGINQMRDRPGMAFGSPTYEVAGNALRQNSNCRLVLSVRAVPAEWKSPDAKTTQFVTEPSLEFKGRTDEYAFKHIRNIKLKHGTPFLQCMGRVWIKDGNKPGQGRGFDKVFDTLEYMKLNGLAELERTSGRLYVKFGNLNNVNKKSDGHPLSGKSIKWLDFKALILDEVLPTKTEYFKEQLTNTLKSLKLKTQPNIHDLCEKHLANTVK